MKENLALFDKNTTQIGTVNKDNFTQQKEKVNKTQQRKIKKPLKKKKHENLKIWKLKNRNKF